MSTCEHFTYHLKQALHELTEYTEERFGDIEYGEDNSDTATLCFKSYEQSKTKIRALNSDYNTKPYLALLDSLEPLAHNGDVDSIILATDMILGSLNPWVHVAHTLNKIDIFLDKRYLDPNNDIRRSVQRNRDIAALRAITEDTSIYELATCLDEPIENIQLWIDTR